MNTLEILDKKAQLKEQAFDMIKKCKEEIRNFTDEELSAFNEIKNKIIELNEEQRKLEVFNSEIKENKKNTMEQNFSLVKAIRNIANNKSLDNVSMAVAEAGAAEMRAAGLNYVGQIQLPTSEVRAITVASEGEDVVATNLMDIVTPLREKNVLVAAGAKFVTGLIGDVQYPVMSSVNTTWEGEIGAAKDGSPVFSSVKLSPKRVTTVVPISKQFIVQDSVGAEMAIREEIINAVNAKLESTILGDGAGSATQPAGMFAGEIPTVTSYAELVDAEAALEENNVYGELKYIVSPRAKAALRNMAKSTKSTQLVYENGEIDGTTALSTSHLKGKNYIYGDFSQMIVAQWGNLDIVVDNVTLAAEGQIRLVVNSYFDVKPLRGEAFKVGQIA